MSDTASISAEQMKLVLEVSRRLTVTADLDALLKYIAEAATSLLQTERASIFLYDPATDELWSKVALGAEEIRLSSRAGIVGHVFQSNQLLEVLRPYEDPRFNRDVDRRHGFVTRNLLTAPLRDVDDRPVGVLQAVNRVNGEFDARDRAMIQLLADQAGVAIQRWRLQQEVLRAAGLRHEMDLAQRVQMAMIPRQPPRLQNVLAAGWIRTASVTGGDSYDLWEMPPGRLGIFLGDASGHGIAAALVVSQLRTLIRTLAEVNCDPTWLLTSVNARLAQDLEAGRFATVFLGCMDRSGILQWSSAGHGPILLRRGTGGKFEVLEPLGPPIGVLPELALEPPVRIQLDPGGTLVVMSDGIFEAPSPAGELLEMSRVVEILQRAPEQSPQAMVGCLRNEVQRWQGREVPVDDQALVVVQYCPG